MEFKGSGGTEIRMSSGFLLKMTRGFRQRGSRVKRLKGVERVKNNFMWLETNCSWLFYRDPLPHSKRNGSVEK